MLQSERSLGVCTMAEHHPIRRRRYTLREKMKLLQDFHADNESVGTFAARNRLPKSTMMKWLLNEDDIRQHRGLSKAQGSELAWKERGMGKSYEFR